MFFNKKNKYIELNHNQLVYALECVSNLDFNKQNDSFYNPNYNTTYGYI